MNIADMTTEMIVRDQQNWLDKNIRAVEVPELYDIVEKAPAPTFHLPDGRLIMTTKQKFQTLEDLIGRLKAAALNQTVYLLKVLFVPPRCLEIEGHTVETATWYVAEFALVQQAGEE